MKRIFVIMLILIVSLGISDVAFAKHHKTGLKKEDHNDDTGRKVTCLVNGAQLMVRTEGVCKDYNGTVVADKAPQEATAASSEKIPTQIIIKPIDDKK